jgi:hypothetical protein
VEIDGDRRVLKARLLTRFLGLLKRLSAYIFETFGPELENPVAEAGSGTG